ncbi:hypothetical protein E3V39_14410 [Gammaproteobacteria bacterium LSUCC0112]|nr:hypothetical protein E3V39_14410 [Gammaproteobacteria bacterium LSUCC0112]
MGFRTTACGSLIVLQRTHLHASPALHLQWSAAFIGACRTGRVGFRTGAIGTLIVLQGTRPFRQAVAVDATIGDKSHFYAHKSVFQVVVQAS